MAITLLGFMYKSPEISLDEFIKHYEEIYVPLVTEIFGASLSKNYKRTYIDRGLATIRGGHEDFDCIAELTFDTEEEFCQMLDRYRNPDLGKKLAKAEAQFMDRGKVKVVRTSGSFA